MITTLLIANRGEIAVRIARTAKKMGIATAGIYSEPDRESLHVSSVDVAVALGGTSPAESYLRSDAVLAAAKTVGADAIHPGYGFLAENDEFAQSVIDAGLIWVGPTPEQIRLLGNKVRAKEAAVTAGVPTAPVWQAAAGSLPDDVTYPALVKAAAGGGGRGMRIVESPADLEAAVDSASREAESAFGDGTVFVEPYIERGRHIEVQILGDSKGNIVHLGERECSIQRRNQKVIEEAPSAGITGEVRTQVLGGALALANHVGYENAGTVEFLVGDDGTINFLEVNTRLQVEHPVTEAVTGLDLVELQLRVAAGEQLPVTQADIRTVGHAIEVRLVAENPVEEWLPSTGEITKFAIDQSLRCDTGVGQGSEISSNYDSLLAKVICWGTTREAAARKLASGLCRSEVAGPRTNLRTLIEILGEPDFLAASTPISYLSEHPDVLAHDGPDDQLGEALLLAAAFADREEARSLDSNWGFVRSGWRNVPTQGHRTLWTNRETERTVGLEIMPDLPAQESEESTGTTVLIGPWPESGEDGVMAEDDRQRHQVRMLGVQLEVDGVQVQSNVTRLTDSYLVGSPFGQSEWSREPVFVDHDSEAAGSGPVSPLPGTVIAVNVSAGDTVEIGNTLMVVEAMKMEHKITAAVAATVTEVRFAEGDKVDQGELLVALESEES